MAGRPARREDPDAAGRLPGRRPHRERHIDNRPDTSTYHMSPGDLGEGIKALLVFRGEGDTERQGAASNACGLSAKA
ncbi:MAG TPA: hypothetical protein VHT50_26290 [Mycobacterium sp.]|nr:hypothetical protein [Mycobacterium sp.]